LILLKKSQPRAGVFLDLAGGDFLRGAAFAIGAGGRAAARSARFICRVPKKDKRGQVLGLYID